MTEPTNINDRTIELITQSESFAMNARQLAYDLKIPLDDAKQELIFELLIHRLKENIVTAITTEQQKMITFAKKDIERRHFKEIDTLLKNEVSDDVVDITNVSSVSQVMATYELDEGQFDDILSAFHSTQRNFVARLLLTGENKTREFTGDSTKVFNQKLKRIIKYVDEHKANFEQRLEMNKEKDIKKTIGDINQFFRMYDADPYLISNDLITEYFEAHQDTLAFTLALDKVHYQGKLFDDWRHHQERTEFLLELNHQQQVLLDKLYPKTAWGS